MYSEKSSVPTCVCCSKCKKDFDDEQQSLIHEPSINAADEDRQTLIESYREQLLTSSYHDQNQLQDDDFEVSLAT